jgi:hypothetical protein
MHCDYDALIMGNETEHLNSEGLSGAHTASYPMGTGSYFPGFIAAGAWS